MSKISLRSLILWYGATVLAASTLGAVQAAGIDSSERTFLSDNQRVMVKMMKGMAPKLTGNVDADFAAMMIPHHQGAIDMAVLELRYGHNEQLRRIAQEIIVDQQQEIVAMRLALGQPLPPSTPAPTWSDRPLAPILNATPASTSIKGMCK